MDLVEVGDLPEELHSRPLQLLASGGGFKTDFVIKECDSSHERLFTHDSQTNAWSGPSDLPFLSDAETGQARFAQRLGPKKLLFVTGKAAEVRPRKVRRRDDDSSDEESSDEEEEVVIAEAELAAGRELEGTELGDEAFTTGNYVMHTVEYEDERFQKISSHERVDIAVNNRRDDQIQFFPAPSKAPGFLVVRHVHDEAHAASVRSYVGRERREGEGDGEIKLREMSSTRFIGCRMGYEVVGESLIVLYREEPKEMQKVLDKLRELEEGLKQGGTMGSSVEEWWEGYERLAEQYERFYTAELSNKKSRRKRKKRNNAVCSRIIETIPLSGGGGRVTLEGDVINGYPAIESNKGGICGAPYANRYFVVADNKVWSFSVESRKWKMHADVGSSLEGWMTERMVISDEGRIYLSTKRKEEEGVADDGRRRLFTADVSVL